MAGPGPCGSLTRIDSSPHEGQVKTDGSFFLTTLMTLLLRLPNQNPLLCQGATSIPPYFKIADSMTFNITITESGSIMERNNFSAATLQVESTLSKKALSEYKTVSVRPFIRLTVPTWCR